MREGRLQIEFKDRTKTFAATVIRPYVSLPKSREEGQVFCKQMLRSGTSVAAHVREASRASSDAEFVPKLGGALHDADETQLWLELLTEECGTDSSTVAAIHAEAGELISIMTTIIRRVGEKQK